MDRRNSNDARMNRGSGGSSLLAGLMIGGLIGAGTMLLLAPQSGRRTRDELQQGAMDLRDRTTDKVRETTSQVRSRAEVVVSNVREKASDLQNQGREIAIDRLDKVASTAQARKKALEESRNNNSEV